MPRLLVFYVTVALLLALASISVACGGEERLTAEEYFTQVHEAEDQYETLITSYEIWSISPYTDLIDTLDGLRPPAEIEPAHDELVAAHTLAKELANQERTGDVFAANDRLIEACLNLQAIADGNSVDIDLECRSRVSRGGPG